MVVGINTVITLILSYRINGKEDKVGQCERLMHPFSPYERNLIKRIKIYRKTPPFPRSRDHRSLQ